MNKDGELVVRDIPRALEGDLLALNNVHAVELSLLDAGGLRVLLGGAFFVRCVGNLDAALIALDERHATYPSPNYLWFRARALRPLRVRGPDRRRRRHAGKGMARRLYADLMDRAVAAGHELIICEVKADPPNPASDAFHAALGFEVGAAVTHGGAKTMRYLALRLGGVAAG